MRRVEVMHWNPRPPLTASGPAARIPRPARINNFGDLLGPMIVERVVRGRLPGLRSPVIPRSVTAKTFGPRRFPRMLAVGSILHWARDGYTVWGTGVNGNAPRDAHIYRTIDVAATRGPLTREYLQELGFAAPEVYGDPALLIPALFPELSRRAPAAEDITVVPNLYDLAQVRGAGTGNILDPRSPVRECIERIRGSALVVGSSLHGIILADAFGVPARAVRSGHENQFKYDDYYLGTGRRDVAVAVSVDEAVEMGPADPLRYDPQPLLDAFPIRLWDVDADG